MNELGGIHELTTGGLTTVLVAKIVWDFIKGKSNGNSSALKTRQFDKIEDDFRRHDERTIEMNMHLVEIRDALKDNGRLLQDALNKR